MAVVAGFNDSTGLWLGRLGSVNIEFYDMIGEKSDIGRLVYFQVVFPLPSDSHAVLSIGSL